MDYGLRTIVGIKHGLRCKWTCSQVTSYFSSFISSGGRQFCLYADVIKHGVWVQFPKTYSSPNFSPVLVCLRYLCPRGPSSDERGPKELAKKSDVEVERPHLVWGG